ncbi:hypothetical protein CC1G_06508 [Coprinopsis cinerea okayama7|uniref:Uncharacterized protein n=1 Tax=Coprinopsis cinerea (strain Okayama-7 / 130 / ATCC MYA-4618 / FGSC 9003) TaxID=240176 RepID=A8NND2_COPC7|nr:hypothetical protein CC1G_06508 [Coprinopsis cinerea okayama7\|eukprot:XP_001835105.1 hypothetical protein CC1G_06508 [Coprinopsis cinerea okayama7\
MSNNNNVSSTTNNDNNNNDAVQQANDSTIQPYVTPPTTQRQQGRFTGRLSRQADAEEPASPGPSSEELAALFRDIQNMTRNMENEITQFQEIDALTLLMLSFLRSMARPRRT